MITEGQALLERRLRERTQKSVADLIGVTQSTISLWARGLARPEPPHRSALLLVLEIPVDAWLTDDERVIVDRAAMAAGKDVLGSPSPKKEKKRISPPEAPSPSTRLSRATKSSPSTRKARIAKAGSGATPKARRAA